MDANVAPQQRVIGPEGWNLAALFRTRWIWTQLLRPMKGRVTSRGRPPVLFERIGGAVWRGVAGRTPHGRAAIIRMLTGYFAEDTNRPGRFDGWIEVGRGAMEWTRPHAGSAWTAAS